MKQQFIQKNNTQSLILFFAGWGMDTNPFLQTFETTSDLCICYDYTSLDFDANIIQSYESITVIAWSFGVWVAAHTLQHLPINIIHSVAINGTCYPIDDTKGIPKAIFEGTLRTLAPRSIDKFNRRMCGNLISYFNAHKPLRQFETLQQELSNMQKHVLRYPIPQFMFDKVVIGQNDLIFPAQNQVHAWQDTSAEISQTDDAHFITSFATGYE